MYFLNHRTKEVVGNKHLLVVQGDELEIFQEVRILSDPKAVYDLQLMEFKNKVEEDNTVYYYTIGDRSSLLEIAEEKGLRRENFISVISTIANSLTQAKSYGLTQNHFVIDKDFIFLGEVDTLLTYVPLETDVDAKTEFKRLLTFFSGRLLDGREDFDAVSAITDSYFSFEDIQRYIGKR